MPSKLNLDKTKVGDEKVNRMHKVIFDSRSILIKPKVDASDKELHRRNGMLNAQKNLTKYLNENKTLSKNKLSFVPSKLGQLTKNNLGVKKNVIEMRQENVDLDKEITPESVNEIMK